MVYLDKKIRKENRMKFFYIFYYVPLTTTIPIAKMEDKGNSMMAFDMGSLRTNLPQK